jgi:hypothetical protein
MHTFRLEWQPGENGYLHWYIDGVYKYGVEQAGLDFMKTKIPNEPSSIIINTAISTSWGFPSIPPGCVLFDCKVPSGQCGFNPGFCQSLPAQMLIDHIRVYQKVNDSTQTVGCDPEGYPTADWIEGHAYRYKSYLDPTPLQPVRAGGGRCTQAAQCGGDGGTGKCDTSESKCVCEAGWTGPHCLVRIAIYLTQMLRRRYSDNS